MNLSTHNSTSTALTVPVFTQEVIQESFTSFDRFMNGVGERIQETGPLFQAVSDAHRYMTSDPQVPVVIRGLMNNEQVISAIHSDPGVQRLLRHVSSRGSSSTFSQSFPRPRRIEWSEREKEPWYISFLKWILETLLDTPIFSSLNRIFESTVDSTRLSPKQKKFASIVLLILVFVLDALLMIAML